MDSHIRFSTLIIKIKDDERRSFRKTPIPLNNICTHDLKMKKGQILFLSALFLFLLVSIPYFCECFSLIPKSKCTKIYFENW